MTVAHRVLGLQIFDSFSAHRVLRLSWIFYSFSAHWVHGLQIFDSFSAHWVLGLRIFDVPWVFLGSVGLPLLRVFWALSVWDFLDSEFLSFPGSKFLGFLNCSEFSRLPLLEFPSIVCLLAPALLNRLMDSPELWISSRFPGPRFPRILGTGDW